MKLKPLVEEDDVTALSFSLSSSVGFAGDSFAVSVVVVTELETVVVAVVAAVVAVVVAAAVVVTASVAAVEVVVEIPNDTDVAG